MVKPAHIELAPVIETVGLTVTVITKSFVHIVEVSVNLMVTVLAETPVTNPAEVTVATPGVRLIHVPPVEGDNVVVDPIHIVLDKANTVGLGFTVILPVVLAQPVDVSVKTNDVVP